MSANNGDQGELWIVIRNWERFQHYRDRNPPWLKIYTELLHDESYLNLTGDQRAILCGLWLEYASSRRRVPLNTRSLSYRLRLRVTRAQLETLNHAGFITFTASPPLAPRYHDASAPRAGGETEQPQTQEDQSQEQNLLPANASLDVAALIDESLATAGRPEEDDFWN